ncbi:MAG: glycine cleavage system aminomethyltransferase GcvT [Clostridia bacterium]|nr:glycine cleavage system aminomethyltransferase GcvT [Clostridia bacterium]
MTQLKRTPLYNEHLKLGAKIVEFGGFEMPVQYKGIIEEHNTVRKFAGLFDVSHMGEIEITGPGAKEFIQKLITNNIEKIEPGKIIYSPICYENGGTVDDLLIYCFDWEHFWMVVNASNTEKDWQWIVRHKENEDVQLKNISDDIGQLALQGPRSQEILQLLTPLDLSSIKYYRFQEGEVAGCHCIISRTGYTGEDGFELYTKSNDVITLWQQLLTSGEKFGLAPIGLGARDTLRFEAGLPLYGHELSPEITPLEAGLGIFVDLKSGKEFIGRDVLLRQKEEGLKRKKVGLEMIERGIPREGYQVYKGEREIGFVTSGSFCPTLGKNLAMALIEIGEAQIDNEVSVMIRNRPCKAMVTKIPFYSTK